MVVNVLLLTILNTVFFMKTKFLYYCAALYKKKCLLTIITRSDIKTAVKLQVLMIKN